MVDSNLATDFQAMMERLTTKLNAMTTVQDIVSALKDEILPYVGNVVEEIGEIDGAVSDLIHEADDILQPESAALVAQLVVASREMVTHFRPKVDKATEPRVWDGLTTILALANQVEALLNDITVIPDEDDDGDERDGEGDEDDGDDEGEDDETGDGQAGGK